MPEAGGSREVKEIGARVLASDGTIDWRALGGIVTLPEIQCIVASKETEAGYVKS